MTQRADRQRSRRMAHRQCGNCGEPATEMKSWAGQTIPICSTCLSRLNTPIRTETFCAFHEVKLDLLRSAALGAPAEADSSATSAGLLRGIWKWLGD